MKLSCGYCSIPIDYDGGPGRPPKYCSGAHRQAAYQERKMNRIERAARNEPIEVVLERMDALASLATGGTAAEATEISGVTQTETDMSTTLAATGASPSPSCDYRAPVMRPRSPAHDLGGLTSTRSLASCGPTLPNARS